LRFSGTIILYYATEAAHTQYNQCQSYTVDNTIKPLKNLTEVHKHEDNLLKPN